MYVTRRNFLAVLLISILGCVLAPYASASIIVPTSLTEVNMPSNADPISWEASRDWGDPYWNDRGETIGQQGNLTDALTGKSMVGLEGLLLSNDAKGTTGNAPGESYEISFQIDPGLVGKARVYVMIGLRDLFVADPEDWLEGRLNDDSYSPQMNVDRNHPDRTWIGLDAYGVPIGSVFNRVLRRPAPDGRPMAFPCRNGVGEEYFAFYHDFDPGETVQIFGCYSSGSNYYVVTEMASTPPPAMWTSEDIGATLTGDTQYWASTAKWDVYADGGDVWGSADAFRYVYTENSGDFLIQGKINALLQANDWAKAGFMVRQSTDAGSPHAFAAVRGVNDYRAIQFRESQGGGSGSAGDIWVSPVMPAWYRMERTGNTFRAYSGSDGVNWTEFNTKDLTLTDPVLVGMALTSHDAARLGSAEFQNVYVSGKGDVFAHAGSDQSVDQADADATFVLDGSGCLDALQFLWTQVSGTPAFTFDPTLQTITLDAKSVELNGDTTFTFLLTATNTTTGASQNSTVQIFITDNEQADAGPDQTVGEGVRVDLDGTGTRGTPPVWTWEQVSGPDIAPIFGADTATPHFTTGDYIGDQVLTFRLSISNDPGPPGTTDYVNVNVTDAEHAIANAGPDQEGFEMRDYQLDATGSDTRDGAGAGALAYLWEQTGGPGILKPGGVTTATPTFTAPEIPLTEWPPTRTLTFRVTVTAPNGSTAQDTVNVLIRDAEFENVFYREHEDFDFHNSQVGGKWYPTEAEFGVHYCSGAVANEVYGTAGRLDPNADYWWNGWGGEHTYRDGVSLSGLGGQVRDTCGTDMKSGWINPGAGDYWKYTFELPTGSDSAYIVNWLGTDNSWHGNSRVFYDYETGNTSPVGVFRICRRGWDNMAPLVSSTFAVQPGLHKILMDAYGGGEPNYSRFELHVPMSWANIADAGPDKGAVAGETVTLDGRGSQATSTSYAWEQIDPASPAVTLTDAGAGVATFTAPAVTDPTEFIFRLTASGTTNDSVDFVHVMVVPADTIYAVYADQRNAWDNTAVDWGNRDLGGAVWGADYQAGNWGALPVPPQLGSDVVAHHNNDGDGDIRIDCWSEYTFNLPAGGAGDYYFYLRAAYQNGDSAFVRPNEGVMGIWPTDTPAADHHEIANDNGYRGQMEWNWADVVADTVPLQEGQNIVRIYGRESKCQEGRPFTFDAMVFSKVALDRGNFEMMDGIARAAQISAAALTASAGADFTLNGGATGVLDATGSLGATSYLWEQTGGPAVAIADANTVAASFTAPAVATPQVLTFRVTIGDGTSTATDTVDATIITAGAPPAMPTNLVAEGVEMGVRLEWDPVPGAVTYKVLRRESWKWWPFDTTIAENLSPTFYIDSSMPVYMDEDYDYTIVAVNAFGESIPAFPAYEVYALSNNLALRPDAGPFAKKPHPGWTLGDLMNNRVKEESFDSWYYSEASADDWWGYTWSEPLYFQEIHYYPGNVFFDGGYWTSLGAQFTKDGVYWYDLPVTIEPPYDYTDSPDGRSPAYGQLPYVRRHIIKFPRVEGIGLRIYGAPGGTVDFTSMAELEVYGVPGDEEWLYSFAGADFSADENTVATLDGSDSSTPLAVQYHWEQVTGAGGQVVQVDMSSAANADVIYAAGEVLADQDAFEPGGDNWLYSSNASIAPAGSNPLPADGKAGPYQLGPYTGNNCLLLSENQRSGVVPVTPGNYGYLGVAFSGASGNHWVNLTLNYADGDSPPIPFEFSDWFFRGDVARAWQNSFRVSRNDEHTGWADGDPGGPNIYTRDLTVDPNRTLVSVTFSGFAGGGNQTGGVFAMNLGPPVPVISLDSPDSAVCTFTVPEVTMDQVVTFRLTVWDAGGGSATDEVDVTLVDVGQSRADAGDDVTALPFQNATLDGSGTVGDIIWWKWEHIGGTPPVVLWNADQGQATIIAPAAGATMLFKVTAGAANGTVSSDTMIVRTAYPANPDPYNIVYDANTLGTLPSVPSSGYIQDVLMCGANYFSRFTSNLDVNYDHLASNGGQMNQVPNAGDSINIGGESFADGPAVWTPMHRDDGTWLGTAEGDFSDFCAYFHVYIISPDQRDARALIRHDDEMRCWNNGALGFQRDGWDDGVEQALDFTLFAGVNCMTYKIHEGGGGNNLNVRFTDRSNNQYSDLRWVTSYNALPPPVNANTFPDPPEPVVVGSGELFYLDGRASTSTAGVDFSWEQVWPTDPAFAMWFDDTNLPIFGAPWVDVDTDFYLRLWADDGTNSGADAVRVTVATKDIPGPISGLNGEWAGDVGAVLRWNAADHASRYNIWRGDDPAGPFTQVGTAENTTMYVDTGALLMANTYYYEVEPASILNVGPVSSPIAISLNPAIGNIAKSDLSLPIVGQPYPLGGGSRDIGLMKDGLVSGQNYDTYDGNTPNPGTLQGEETFEFFGYLFDQPIEVHSLVYYTGGVFGDGGWWTTIGVQVTRDGYSWEDAEGVVSGPVYDTADSNAGRGSNEKYIFSIIPDTVTGVRIAGHAGGSARFVSIAELEVYADSGGLSVSAGADGAVNELDPVTLDGSATTGADTYAWTQVAGPSVIINNADQAVASFTAPGVIFQEQVTFRLTASNAQWEAWDEVTFTVFDVDTWHFYRYSADFDGRSTTGALIFADGQWVQGYGAPDCTQYMGGVAANEAPDEASVAGNDFFFQNADRTNTYRPALDPFDVRFSNFGVCGDEPYIGYTTGRASDGTGAGDWWNYTFSSSKTQNTRFPADGVMYVSAFACTGNDNVTAEILLDEVPVTAITFPNTGWGNFGWRPGTDSFLVTAGSHSIRVHLTLNGWDFCKFRFDLAVPAIEQIAKLDGQGIIRWNDVGREYVLQAAYDPAGPWMDVYGPTTETYVIDDIPADPWLFYRVKVQ